MTALALVAAALVGPSAQVKDFGPGDLRLCDAGRCVAVRDRPVLRTLSRFYYSTGEARRARAVRVGAPYLQLRFRNGYVTGIVATAKLDRFLGYGVHLERFRRGAWYRVPEAAAAELRLLSRGLTPLRVTREALAGSR